MTVIDLDLPLAILVGLALALTLLRYGRKAFVLACHSAATFGAQFSLGVTLSTGKIIPILLSPAGLVSGHSGLLAYVPFTIYAIAITVLCSFLWVIPDGVSYFYGEARVFVQLFNLSMLILAARATALALSDRNSTELFWRFFTFAVVVHGIASAYQVVAFSLGLPLIGISRPFGLSVAGEAGDVALFVTPFDTVLVRPGGLAGEPKTVAIIFGIYAIAYYFGGRFLNLGRRWYYLTRAALALAVFGFVAAFSTSAIFGVALAAPIALVMGGKRHRLAVLYLPLVSGAAFAAWGYFSELSDFAQLLDIFHLRTTTRLEGELDPPIAASIDAMRRNPLIALFGYGMGGSSFLTMEYLGEVFEYAYAPNVGIVFLIVEFGFIGTLLLIGPLMHANFRVLRHMTRSVDAHVMMLVAISISAICLCLTGSGVALGYPLALGAAAGAATMQRRSKSTPISPASAKS